jgi:N-acetylglucosamine-6-phosphate deacetylase
MQLHARRYDNHEPVRIDIDGERIAAVTPATPDGDASAWPIVAPGLFDLQINGYGGVWFSDEELTPAKVVAAVEPYFRFGVTRLFPTLITNSFAGLAGGLAAIRGACEQQSWLEKVVAGCHVEGPYLSGEDGPRGAHPKQHIRDPAWDEFQRLQDAAGGRIKLFTIAPEKTGAAEFIRRAVASGVTISIGHTAANGDQIRAAVNAGATLSTHLGNGAHAVLPRHPNYIWEQLGEPRLAACIISDGHHLPPSVVSSIVRAKTPRKTVITCDASGWAGCAPGVYENKLGKVEVLDDGRIVPAGQRTLLAGSGSGTDVCVTNAVRFAGVSLREAIDMAGLFPSRLVGLPEIALRPGSRADLFLFRTRDASGGMLIEKTIVAGEVRYRHG